MFPDRGGGGGEGLPSSPHHHSQVLTALPRADMFLFCPQPMSSYTLLAENSYIKMVSEA